MAGYAPTRPRGLRPDMFSLVGQGGHRYFCEMAARDIRMLKASVSIHSKQAIDIYLKVSFASGDWYIAKS